MSALFNGTNQGLRYAAPALGTLDTTGYAILLDRDLGRRRYDGVAFSFDAKVEGWP